MKALGLAALFVVVLSGTTFAQTATFFVGIEDYDRIADVQRGDEVNALNRFTNTTRPGANNPNSQNLLSMIANYEENIGGSKRQIIVLSGRFVHSASETYFLPKDARPVSLTNLSRTALPLSVVLALLAETPGEAVLALATDGAAAPIGKHLAFGVGDIELPQGVTLLQGGPRDMARGLETLLRDPGRRIANVVNNTRIQASGFLRQDQVLRDVAVAPQPAPTPQAQTAQSQSSRVEDLLAWRQADRANTLEAYEAYLNAQPNGQFTRMAQSRIQALTDTPQARAQRAEQRLDLNRDQRREIQRDLSLLNYNTRGIDGIFGQGTRAAIVAWQGDNRHEKTGFLNEEQIRQLDAQSERKSAQLEAEAQARREAQVAADRAFWRETGAFEDEAGFRAYLERFPDGEFSDVAKARLEDIERRKRRQANAQDRRLWDDARVEDTVQGYSDYLQVAPTGMFRKEAEARILELRAANSGALEQARREEQALNLNSRMRRMVEARLEAFGLKPGVVDGEITDDTRRAIRRYQEARNFPQTGFLSEQVVVRILADSVRTLFR